MGKLIQFPAALGGPSNGAVVQRVVAIINCGYWKDISEAALRDYAKRVAAMQEP